MNCFVIMPYAPEFDDVYQVIKDSAEKAGRESGLRCFRLDESRPAGRITDRLVSELKTASFCIADLTGATPNVMWELGFAMAMGKPAIVVTQSTVSLPFDLKDMQAAEYQRNHLSASLGGPLQKMVTDTLSRLEGPQSSHQESDSRSELVGAMKEELSQLKQMVAEAVQVWKRHDTDASLPAGDLRSIEGSWINTESGTHLYARIVNGELVAPYCWMANTNLDSLYFGWRRTGDHWFARFQWVQREIRGFAFLRPVSEGVMEGAWWGTADHSTDGESLPAKAGIPTKWVRLKNRETPDWAEACFREIERKGLAAYIATCGN